MLLSAEEQRRAGRQADAFDAQPFDRVAQHSRREKLLQMFGSPTAQEPADRGHTVQRGPEHDAAARCSAGQCVADPRICQRLSNGVP